jgi:hypothetical protein
MKAAGILRLLRRLVPSCQLPIRAACVSGRHEAFTGKRALHVYYCVLTKEALQVGKLDLPGGRLPGAMRNADMTNHVYHVLTPSPEGTFLAGVGDLGEVIATPTTSSGERYFDSGDPWLFLQVSEATMVFDETMILGSEGAPSRFFQEFVSYVSKCCGEHDRDAVHGNGIR